MIYILSLLIGVIAGLRAMTAPAAIAWASYLGWLNLSGTWLSFMSSVWTVAIFTVLALVEFVTDQLPSTPSRKVPQQFGARLISGAVCGAAMAVPFGGWTVGLVAGVVGAVAGTYGGAAVRSKLAVTFGSDPPAAFIEDAVAIVGALFLITTLSMGQI